jgi:PGF-CTERM protein
MKGILTVGILMLTVFLLSAPAQAGTDFPYVVVGQATYPDGAPADGAVVTVCVDGDPSRSTTGVVGISYSPNTPDLWKVDLFDIEGSIEDGTPMVVSIADDNSSVGRTTSVVDTSSMDAHRVADITLAPAETGSRGGSGGSGTYPPGWDKNDKAAATGPAATSTDDTSSDSTETEESTGEAEVTEDGSATDTTAGGSTDGTTEPTDDDASEDTGEDADKTTEMQTPGFGALFAVVGMLAVAFMALRRRD